jgi:hypothetical protein
MNSSGKEKTFANCSKSKLIIVEKGNKLNAVQALFSGVRKALGDA